METFVVCAKKIREKMKSDFNMTVNKFSMKAGAGQIIKSFGIEMRQQFSNNYFSGKLKAFNHIYMAGQPAD